MIKIFIDEEHKKTYKKYIEKDNTAASDLYRKSLFYILSSIDKFRIKINKIYNFKQKGIYSNASNEILLSDSEKGLLRLAFHLYNSKNKFDLDLAFSNFESKSQIIALNAIQIRYNGNLLQ